MKYVFKNKHVNMTRKYMNRKIKTNMIRMCTWHSPLFQVSLLSTCTFYSTPFASSTLLSFVSPCSTYTYFGITSTKHSHRHCKYTCSYIFPRCFSSLFSEIKKKKKSRWQGEGIPRESRLKIRMPLAMPANSPRAHLGKWVHKGKYDSVVRSKFNVFFTPTGGLLFILILYSLLVFFYHWFFFQHSISPYSLLWIKCFCQLISNVKNI